jgi:mycofactocin glycosyltransferase
MAMPADKGTCYLKPGTRLIARESDGVVLSDSPLRAFRVNTAALRILERCRAGLPAVEVFGSDIARQSRPHLSLFDRLCQVGLMEWKPPEQGFEPFVSIVVPVYNRADQIGACLESLCSLDYPASKREIIVVDDASQDRTAAVVAQWDVTLIVFESNRGQSAARNVGAAAARGEIIAYIDSDCIADPLWLRELVPYFQDSRHVLVGGYVDSFYRTSRLDRYEEAQSPLNMGQGAVVGSGASSDFYVPTCNMLVRRDVYLQVGGLDETLRVGEDVDLCWRLKEKGCRLLYAPKGRVRHKHRNRFLETFTRRFDYGTSEPVLYAAHTDVSKRFPWQHSCMALFFTCIAGLLTQQALCVPAACLIVLADSLFRQIQYRKQMSVTLPFLTVFRATWEKHFHLLYYLSFHVIRYYLLLLIALAILFNPLIPVVAGLVAFTAVATYFKKGPRLGLPWFVFFFVTEQAFYQAGVFRASLRLRSFRPYRLSFAFRADRKKSPQESRKVDPVSTRAQGASISLR